MCDFHGMIFSPRNLSFGVVVCSNHQRSEENFKQFSGWWGDAIALLIWYVSRPAIQLWLWENHQTYFTSWDLRITLPESNIAPENRLLEKEIPIGNHQFLGAAKKGLVSERVTFVESTVLPNVFARNQGRSLICWSRTWHDVTFMTDYQRLVNSKGNLVFY